VIIDDFKKEEQVSILDPESQFYSKYTSVEPAKTLEYVSPVKQQPQ
jgi:hypothetical protein